MRTSSLLVFDIDGTLVNTEKSYLEAIKLTVEYFLKKSINRQIISDTKMLSGFNNDWIVAYAITNAALTSREIEEFKTVKNDLEKISFSEIKDVFQCYYLGNSLFKEIEGKKPIINIPKGLWETETLIFSSEQLSELNNKFGLFKIITGRTYKEAILAIQHFKINHFFDQVVSVEDMNKNWFEFKPELSVFGKDKQNPVLLYQLNEVEKYGCIYYVGDSISDMQLAYNARPALNVLGLHLLETFKNENRIEIINKASEFSPYKTVATHEEVCKILLNI